MIDRKLQIFVSSTYTDLKSERQAAVEAILQAGHIPAGMELFTAGDESQLVTILRWIDQADALLLILGERYGSLEPKSGKSYTQVEYEHAIENGKPVFSLVISDDMIQKKYATLGRDATDDHRVQHKVFKEIVLSKICRIVDDEKDIRIEITRVLSGYALDENMTGWIRANEFTRTQSLLSELQNTISQLRENPKSQAPTLEELRSEFEARSTDLKSITIDETRTYTDRATKKIERYRVSGHGLGITYFFRADLASGNIITFDDTPNSRVFEHKIEPILDVWEMTTTRHSRMAATSKGQLFFQFLDDLDLQEEDWISCSKIDED